MSKLLRPFFLILLSFPMVVSAQVVYNNGVNITVDGTSMVVTGGDLEQAAANGSEININNDGYLEVAGGFINADSVAVNSGMLVVDLDFSDDGVASYVWNGDTIVVHGDFGYATGTYSSDTTAAGNSVLIFDDANSRTIASNNTSLYRQIDFSGGGSKGLNGVWRVKDLNFDDGIAIQNSDADTLFMYGNGQVISHNINSFYDGEFWAEGTGVIDYPIGNGTDWRPIRLLNNPVSSLLGFKVSDLDPTSYAPVPGIGVIDVSDRRYWRANDLGGNYAGSQVEILFAPADTVGTGAVNLAALSVVQSDSTGPYNSIGNNGITNVGAYHRITSSLAAGENFLTLGSGCSNVKLDIRVYLEGAYDGGPAMISDAGHQTNTDGEYSDNASGNTFTGNKGMYPGYFLPTGANDAVDVILIVLRSSSMPYNPVDTATVWLMEDGSIVDFWSGTAPYATFCKAVPGTDYYVEVLHRNHLPVMSASSIVASTAVPGSFVDFRSDLNIYGGGGVVQYGTDFYVVGGNANSDKSVNGIDRFQILVDQSNLVSGYTGTNVDFNSGVDAADEQVGQANSFMLHFSTSP